jgi:hypothetical protein
MGQVWGGMRIYSEDKTDEIFSALHAFVPGNNDDTKAAIILTHNFNADGSEIFLIFYYYEGPEPPTTGAFAKFLEIEPTIDQTATRSYADMVSLARGLPSTNFNKSDFSNFLVAEDEWSSS